MNIHLLSKFLGAFHLKYIFLGNFRKSFRNLQATLYQLDKRVGILTNFGNVNDGIATPTSSHSSGAHAWTYRCFHSLPLA